ncbi:hypothetical protein BCV72DRAFT_233527 [Rhizopus microsporus var. microsporus]|uniref:Uncharacterized protein n=1 Tax=Rhizopus microsporus var. microsporus TaxID=86635 RepID=A0A1X0QTM5_RHIZD|nr:hypothetical protein BCV72DRAFT_233527 [Rhizopus microsporus var. microsporus]
MDGYFGLVEAKTDYKKKDSVKTHKDLLQLCLFGVNALEQYGTICILLMQVIGKMKLEVNFTFLVCVNNILHYRP